MKMNRLILAAALVALGLFLGVGATSAATTRIFSGPETPLVDTGGILDQIYGLNNLIRVDDRWDQIWSPSSGDVTVKAKFAAFEQDFGYIPQNIDGSFNETDFVRLFKVSGHTNGIHFMASTVPFHSHNANFVWALNPSGAPMWTSQPNSAIDGFDHMVTWYIADNDGINDHLTGTFVLAWEDLYGGGDRDFNDLVVEVHITQVPLPGSFWILSSGFISLVGFRIKIKMKPPKASTYTVKKDRRLARSALPHSIPQHRADPYFHIHHLR